jgi:hypothetical protein
MFREADDVKLKLRSNVYEMMVLLGVEIDCHILSTRCNNYDFMIVAIISIP